MLRAGIRSALPGVVLLLLVLLTPAQAVATAQLDRTLPFALVSWIVLAAVCAGAVVTVTRWAPRILHPLALVGGLTVIVCLVAWGTGVGPTGTSPDARVAQLVGEVESWLHLIATGGQATDNRLFLLFIGMFAWALGYTSAWAVLRRRQVFLPVAVSLMAFIFLLSAFPGLSTYALVDLVTALLLVRWVNRGRADPVPVRWQVVGLAPVLALVTLGWLAPTSVVAQAFASSPTSVRAIWVQEQGSFFHLFGGLQSTTQASQSGFTGSLSFHGSFHLGDTPVLQIAAAQPAYWRAVVYDQYTGHGWQSSSPSSQTVIQPGAGLSVVADRARAALTQQVTVLTFRGTYLVGAEQPVGFDQPVRVQTFPTRPRGTVDLISASSVQAIGPDSRYTVTSNVSTASVDQLRSAGTAYPSQIRQRYLALPQVPDRVGQLAQRLTAPATNPYDKAVAVEDYLHTLTYSLDVPTPPANRDGVDYFLFDSKTGYCDYFASAMAVLLRDAGIPARVVSGYATGDQQSDGTYLVRDANAHSWTEVYFPQYGWIPFNPSAGWPRFARGASGSTAAAPTPAPTSFATAVQPTATPVPTAEPPLPTQPAGQSAALGSPLATDGGAGWLLLAALGGLGIVSLGGRLAWRRWNRAIEPLPPAARGYVKMTRLARLLGHRPRPTDTPIEFGRTLARAIPEEANSIRWLAGEYARFRFGPPESTAGVEAEARWPRVRSALLRQLLPTGWRRPNPTSASGIDAKPRGRAPQSV